MWMRATVLWLLIAAACGSDSPDTIPIDARPDSPPALSHYHYVVDSITIPTTSAQAHENGLDLNGNGTIDNQLGMVMGALTGQGIDLQSAATTAIGHGTVNQLVELRTTSFGDAAVAELAIYSGAAASPAACDGPSDTTCRHHLDGNGAFSIATDAATDLPLEGAFTAGTLVAGPGRLTLFVPFSDRLPVQITLVGARVSATMAAPSTLGRLVLAGAVTQPDIDAKLLPALRDIEMANVMRDCTALLNPPSCGCASNTAGKTALMLFDISPTDCSVTVDELSTNPAIRSLFAPDVVIDGQRALSLGLGMTAVPATFNPP